MMASVEFSGEDVRDEVIEEAEKFLPSKANNPELENFLSRVEEISQVIHSLSSENKTENERGLRQADILLNSSDRDIDETEVKVKSSRTIINKIEDKPQGEMSQDAFMRMVELDAKERAENRKMRKQKSDSLLDDGVKLFRKEDYASALSKFNKAIEWTKDSPLLYCNRAITFIRLKLYSKAIEDCDKAISLSERSLKARLYKAKAYCLMGDVENCRKYLEEAKEINPEDINMIEEYERSLGLGS